MGMEINVLTQVLLLKHGLALYLLLFLAVSLFQLPSVTWLNLYLCFCPFFHPSVALSFPYNTTSDSSITEL